MMKRIMVALAIFSMASGVALAGPGGHVPPPGQRSHHAPRHAPPPPRHHHYHHNGWIGPVAGFFTGLIVGNAETHTETVRVVESPKVVVVEQSAAPSVKKTVRTEIRHPDGRVEVISETYE